MEEILDVVKTYQHVINSPTWEEFDELFAKNSEVSLISITKEFVGKENVYNDFLMGAIHTIYSSIELVNDGVRVNMVNDQLAIVVFKYHTVCVRKETNEPYGIEGLETQVVIKEDGKWRILHIHYSK